ncbi:hypothetical protein [Culicoidibacter larvae]|uniref:Head-tail adaptor protein n=1 Tax=Culicoidibacter larvae TaxID=2579976 RepID=A0A5R8Q8L0_9FIRM|nr:hypothetical protein [Culicoidibacter larvae]TLG72052.1 hypothetical protein FEZ08_09470 [Culicoidibacter larvae]
MKLKSETVVLNDGICDVGKIENKRVNGVIDGKEFVKEYSLYYGRAFNSERFSSKNSAESKTYDLQIVTLKEDLIDKHIQIGDEIYTVISTVDISALNQKVTMQRVGVDEQISNSE